MKMTYSVECYGGGNSGHKTWGVYRDTVDVFGPSHTLVCVCVYKRGAIEVCNELNTLVKLKGEIL